MSGLWATSGLKGLLQKISEVTVQQILYEVKKLFTIKFTLETQTWLYRGNSQLTIIQIYPTWIDLDRFSFRVKIQVIHPICLNDLM